MVDAISFFSMLEYMIKAIILISTGIVFVNILGETGLFKRLQKVSRPLCRISGLSEGAAISVLSMAVNSIAGKSMLAEYYREGKVKKEEIVPSLLIGTFPTVLGESLFRVQLPTAVILLGPVIGFTYTFFNFFSSFLQAFFAILYNHIVLHENGYIPKNETGDEKNGNSKDSDEDKSQEKSKKKRKITKKNIKNGFKKSIPGLKQIIPITISAMLVFYLLSLLGLMNIIAMVFDPLLNIIGLPGEATAALVAQFIHFSAGYTIVGSLIETGVLNMEQALVTLILGSMVVITMIYVKYSFPMYLALFGKDGLMITYKTYAISMAAKIVCIGIVMVVF
ncbi:nucleoside recognition protein [Methanomicrobium antiquum]|uniref:Nucleoside recognition protein n=1 Tax=Methanomicrobium antiquum TaxID=487686 RepID=A0AAF0JMN9_9EURY|nr:nucleoside recognition domain-containing protein [Methanomicrobium antiquum]WFN37332.1 nucleoside recognition protein [Methanomicrobium antiquum]